MKIWYYKAGLNVWYLRALLATPELFEKGLPQLLHFQQVGYYKKIFKGGELVVPAMESQMGALMDDAGGLNAIGDEDKHQS